MTEKRAKRKFNDQFKQQMIQLIIAANHVQKLLENMIY